MLHWLKRSFLIPPRQRPEPEPFEPLPTSNAAGFQVSFQAGGGVPQRPAGLRFHAQLYLWTPLSVLRMHGQFIPEDGAPPLETILPEFGAWVGEPASPPGWEPPELETPSDVGPVKPSAFLPFLKAFRAIVESDLEPQRQAQNLNRLHLLHPPWKPFVETLRRPSGIHPDGAPDLASVWFCPHLEANLKGVGPKLASALYDAGFLTPGQVLESPSEALLRVPGLTRAALRKIRTA